MEPTSAEGWIADYIVRPSRWLIRFWRRLLPIERRSLIVGAAISAVLGAVGLAGDAASFWGRHAFQLNLLTTLCAFAIGGPVGLIVLRRLGPALSDLAFVADESLEILGYGAARSLLSQVSPPDQATDGVTANVSAFIGRILEKDPLSSQAAIESSQFLRVRRLPGSAPLRQLIGNKGFELSASDLVKVQTFLRQVVLVAPSAATATDWRLALYQYDRRKLEGVRPIRT